MRSLVTFLFILLVVAIALPMVVGPLWMFVRLPISIIRSVLHSLWIVPQSVLGGLRGSGFAAPWGIVLLALAALAVLVLVRTHRVPGDKEKPEATDGIGTRGIQETHRRLERMHRRVEALETVLIERAQGTARTRKRSSREKIRAGV